jgi:hypothetical protein
VKTIWKYPISVTDRQSVRMPAGAKILTVAVRHETVCLWAEVDPAAPKTPRAIAIHGTGHEKPDMEGAYIGTFMLLDGDQVFHAYDVTAD